VNTKGKVISAAVVDGHPMARQAVLESVQKWQFKPLRIDGHLEDVLSDLKVDYDFRAPAQGNGPSQ
jgi:outer membrane biosynthesis protein TonB